MSPIRQSIARRLHRGAVRARRVGARADDITVAEAEELLRRQATECAVCASLLPTTLDHIVPLSRGGEHRVDNLQWLCATCDRLKGDGTLGDLYEARDAWEDYLYGVITNRLPDVP